MRAPSSIYNVSSYRIDIYDKFTDFIRENLRYCKRTDLDTEPTYGDTVQIIHRSQQCVTALILKLIFRKYPAIHTHYIISHCTTLQYNHNNIYDTLLRQKRNFIHKNYEFNSAAIFLVWHELPMFRRGQINVADIRRRQEI